MFLNLKKAPVFVLLAPAVHTQITVHKGPFRNPLRLLCCLIVTYRSAVGPALGRRSGWKVLDTQRSLRVQTKTAHHHPWHPRCFAPHVALTRPPLSRFALHFARLNGYLDSGFLVCLDKNCLCEMLINISIIGHWIPYRKGGRRQPPEKEKKEKDHHVCGRSQPHHALTDARAKPMRAR